MNGARENIMHLVLWAYYRPHLTVAWS